MKITIRIIIFSLILLTMGCSFGREIFLKMQGYKKISTKEIEANVEYFYKTSTNITKDTIKDLPKSNWKLILEAQMAVI